jgi:quaternary ammonium compound-resistance protein SugE
VALGKSQGLSRPAPSAVFLEAITASMLGLAHATRRLPTGTA